MPVMLRARTVEALVQMTAVLESIRKEDLRRGDRILVATENSIYSISVLDEATYSVSGGWFDRQGLSPVRTSIAGCTWGGSAIKRDIVAACGLRLEFGNRVVTTRIRQVRLIRSGTPARPLEPIGSRELFGACYGAGGAAWS
jgi:hypothetical protein